MPPLLKLMRPHQYVKNTFVFLGPLFAHQWDLATITSAVVAFFAFSFMASAVYVLNDIVDVEADREHPIKCKRPLPSGKVPMGLAKSLLVGLIVLATALSLFVNVWATVFVVIYFAMNILYSWRLKHVVILDVFIISAGFMLRILTGTIGLDIEPTAWLLLCGLMVTLFLGFSKRRAELLMIEASGQQNLTRKVLDDYNPQMLEQMISVTAACTVISYGLYTVSPDTVALHGSDHLVYTLPFVVYGIFRYLFLLHRKAKGNDTAKDLVADKHMLTTAIGWCAITLWVLA